MLYLLACAAHHPYVRTAEDMAGDWIADEEQARLSIRFDEAGPTATLTVPVSGRPDTPVTGAGVVDQAGNLHVAMDVEFGLLLHTFQFGGPDALVDVMRSGERERVMVFRRDTPEGRAAQAAATAGVERSRQERELRQAVDGIRIAELAYDAAFDSFVPCGLQPRALTALDATAVPFQPIDGFERIGWTPDGAVTGTYQVTVSADGHGFVVDGWQDLDHDGVPAHWAAELDRAAHRVSPEGVK